MRFEEMKLEKMSFEGTAYEACDSINGETCGRCDLWNRCAIHMGRLCKCMIGNSRYFKKKDDGKA